MLTDFYGDLHVHIGGTRDGLPVKVTAARAQTLKAIIKESKKKGLNLLGIVDCACPRIYQELIELTAKGEAEELSCGGLYFGDNLTVITGSEIEVVENNGGHAHWLAYFPKLKQLGNFKDFLKEHLTNPELSTQTCSLTACELFSEVTARGGIFFPAHAFTPHKGVYGQCTASLQELLGDNFADIPAIELGLSADTGLADYLSEISGLTFLSNSDAHSFKSLGREYNIFSLYEANWEEFLKALKREDGRKVKANYGLDPRLGKYHRTFCLTCQKITEEQPPVQVCSYCGSKKIVYGVFDRIAEIRDRKESCCPSHRPPYYYQVPLAFLPGVGPKTINKLLEVFGTEMYVIHKASFEELEKIIGHKTATLIWQARHGELMVKSGGGGTYGKIAKN